MAVVNLNPIECPPTLPLEWNKIALIGEAPGAQELSWTECPLCLKGTPYPGKCPCGGFRIRKPQGFVGGAGNVLRAVCRAVGINFGRCYRTNVVKRGLSKNDFSVLYNDPKERCSPTPELSWWHEFLIRELASNRPNVVVALGNEALKALMGYDYDGISKWAGSILESPRLKGLKVIPAFHPAYIMRDNWEEYYVEIRHFRKVVAEATAPQRILPESIDGRPDEFIVNPSFEQAMDFITRIGSSSQPWYLDVETRGDSLVCFGLSCDEYPGHAICIPIQTVSKPYWTVEQEAHIWRGLSKAMGDNPRLRNQNLVYDLDYMLDYRCEPGGLDFDPMIAMNVAYAEFSRGLDYTTALFTNRTYYKDEGKTTDSKTPDRDVWVYNCKDMVATPEVSNHLVKDLREMGLWDIYLQRSHKFLPIALEMQRNKIRLDREWHTRLAGYLREERAKVHQKLTELIGQDINVKSSLQVAKLLYEDLKLPVKRDRKTGKPSTGEYLIQELRVEHPNIPHLKLIVEERHLRTKESNNINVKFDTGDDGELYLGYMANIGGAKTGRWSYATSPKWRGGSPQTIPKIMRLMYVPPKGSVFWQRDLSQAEARIVAWLADCKFLLDVFASPIKIHKLVGARIFKKRPEEIIADSLEYDISKRVVHGYDYMMQAKKIAILANIPIPFAEFAYAEYGKEVHEIDDWQKNTGIIATREGRLVTPMGRVRQCYKACSAVTHTGALPDEILRDLVSYVPQSTVPDVLNVGMYDLWENNPWVRWHQQGHDSYLASGPADRTEEFYHLAEKAANVHFRIRDFDCFIPGEFQWGYSWGAMLAYKPGEATDYDSWLQRATSEGCFKEEKIKERLYSTF